MEGMHLVAESATKTPEPQTEPTPEGTPHAGGLDVDDAGATGNDPVSNPDDPFAALLTEGDVSAAVKASPALQNFVAVQAANAVSDREGTLASEAEQNARTAIMRSAGNRDATRNRLAALVDKFQGRAFAELEPQEQAEFHILDDANRVTNTADVLIAIQAAGIKRAGGSEAMVTAFRRQVEGADFTEAGRLKSLAESTETMYDEAVAATIAHTTVADFLETMPSDAPFRVSLEAHARELAAAELTASGIAPSGDALPPTNGASTSGGARRLTKDAIKAMTEDDLLAVVGQSKDADDGWQRISLVAAGKPDPGA